MRFGIEVGPQSHRYDEDGADELIARFAQLQINQVAGVNPGTLAVHDGKVLEFMAIRRDRDSAFFRAAQQCLAVPTSDIVRDVVSELNAISEIHRLPHCVSGS